MEKNRNSLNIKLSYTKEEIYTRYLKARGHYFKRPWKKPQNFKDKFSMMGMKEQENLIEITRLFSSEWMNINPDLFFRYGFELFKNSFTLTRIFNDKLIKFYTARMKSIDIQDDKARDLIKKSLKFLIDFMKQHELRGLRHYLNTFVGSSVPVILMHWRQRRIDPFTFLFIMIRHKNIFKEYPQDISEIYIGSNFIKNMHTWRNRLIEREELKNLIEKGIKILEKI